MPMWLFKFWYIHYSQSFDRFVQGGASKIAHLADSSSRHFNFPFHYIMSSRTAHWNTVDRHDNRSILIQNFEPEKKKIFFKIKTNSNVSQYLMCKIHCCYSRAYRGHTEGKNFVWKIYCFFPLNIMASRFRIRRYYLHI